MRIVAGEFRGRRIEAPDSHDTRPTTDRVREALMSSIHSAIGGFAGVRVLDAFAGSGALGLEALSRGASHVVFYETERRAQRALQSNIETLGVGSRSTVARADVLKAIARGSVLGGPFGLLLLDPPYTLRRNEVFTCVSSLADAGILEQECVVAYEFAAERGSVAHEVPEHFELVSEKRYGTTGTLVMRYYRQEDGS